jgi:predicted phosphodiesterase
MGQILRLVGDVHGKMDCYLSIINHVDYSIQLGDLGFVYDELEKVSSDRHKVLAGNHDNYDRDGDRFVKQTPHFLGDFGIYHVPGVSPFFFVRGGASIDKMQRRIGFNWWPEEELGYSQMVAALDAYRECRPEMVISHECPVRVISEVGTMSEWNGETVMPSITARLLQEMWKSHRPKYWFFGHHHQNWTGEIDGTTFMCLGILSVYDIQLS